MDLVNSSNQPIASLPTAPTMNLNMFGLGSYNAQSAKLPRVSNTSEAERYPSVPGTESVLMDSKDPDIFYFRETDLNNFTRVKRCRSFEEPEQAYQPVMENLNYISKDEFAKFINDFSQFKEEITNGQQSIRNELDALRKRSAAKPHGSYAKPNTGYKNNYERFEEQPKPARNDASYDSEQSSYQTKQPANQQSV